ncbi:MAG: L-serine ammonia-lyase, iron-sulfur-dependent subunit beta [Holophagaceae bacterium]|nr:L-serine ammonia-lyase, iron-sulfur-dependent subunit beta [Holophagaceae bacterium]
MGILDVIGPIMVGPSSSHTAGACRIGLFAKKLLGQRAISANFFLHGSFSATGEGHGTPLALLAGLMGWSPEDTRIQNAMKIANKSGLDYKFSAQDLGNVHPNSVMIQLKGKSNKVEVCASSIGGGQISVWSIDGFAVELNGENPTLLVSCPDRRGLIASISSIIAEAQISIAAMKVHRNIFTGKNMMTIELDNMPPLSIIDSINNLTNIDMVRLISSVFSGT